MKKKISWFELIIIVCIIVIFIKGYFYWNRPEEVSEVSLLSIPTDMILHKGIKHNEKCLSIAIPTITPTYTVTTQIGELTPSPTTPIPQENYVFATKWGSYGTDDGQFNNPTTITIDLEDNIYIIDAKNMRIQKFDCLGNFITKWGSQGEKDGQFKYLSTVAVDTEGNIYTSDFGRIQKFTSNGDFITKWFVAIPENNPSIICQSPGIIVINEYIYLLIFLGIYKFDFNGNCIDSFSCLEFTAGDKVITVVAVDSSGNFFIVTTVGYLGTYRSYIQKYSPDGKFIANWDFQEKTLHSTTPPPAEKKEEIKILSNYFIDIAIDHEDNVFATDANNHCIWKFDRQGNILARWGAKGDADGQFEFPSGIAIDSKGNIYVVDSGNNRIQKFISTREEIK